MCLDFKQKKSREFFFIQLNLSTWPYMLEWSYLYEKEADIYFSPQC